MKDKFFKALLSLIGVSIVVAAVVSYFMFDRRIGLAFLGMGFLSIGFIKLLKIKWEFIYPDFAFGFVDNGIMVFAAILGGSIGSVAGATGGVAGAIIGAAAGNTITDGIGGFFEEYISEKQNSMGRFKDKRRILSASLGKMTGCMFGAGLSLTIAWVIGFI